MITYSGLGKEGHGNLGNSLFQIASLIGIAKRLNTSYAFPQWKYAKYFTNEFPITIKNLPELKEPHYHYSDDWFRDDHDYHGWLQSEKYFDKDFRFQFEPIFKSLVQSKFNKALSRPTIGISIRRGDYVGNINYHQLSILYYLTALYSIEKYRDCNVILFSDDLNYCRVHFTGDQYYFADGSDIEQLCLMSMCDSIIIANSTFSWWGAWLSNANVIHSGKLFAGPLLKNNASDFYPDNWTRIEDKKIDLNDVTFMIPVKNDSQDRMQNMKLNISYLRRYFNTNIIIGEQGTNDFKNFPAIYEHFYDIKEFHRTRMLNEMAGMSSTPIIVNWDADVFCPVNQIVAAVDLIRSGSDMVYPYDGRMARVPRHDIHHVMQLDLGLLTSRYRGTFDYDLPSVGGAIFFNKESFIAGGMENERFVSYGPEDSERYHRFRTLGFEIDRVPGIIYHLDHQITTDSSIHQPYFSKNQNEWEMIKLMDAAAMKDYIQNFGWLKYYLHLCKQLICSFLFSKKY